MLRRSALLLLLLFAVTAQADRSFNLFGLIEVVPGITVVLCPGYTITRYVDDVVQLVPCPPQRARINRGGCTMPSLVTLAPSSYRLICA